MALKPDVVQTLLGSARMEVVDRKFPRALALRDDTEWLFPGNPSIHLTRATVLSRMKRNEEALALLNGGDAPWAVRTVRERPVAGRDGPP